MQVYILYLFSSGEAFYHLDAPVMRVTCVDTPMPYARTLENASLPQANDIVYTVNKILGLVQ